MAGTQHRSFLVARIESQPGRARLVAYVAADGTPTLTFLGAKGKVTAQWSDKEAGDGKGN